MAGVEAGAERVAALQVGSPVGLLRVETATAQVKCLVFVGGWPVPWQRGDPHGEPRGGVPACPHVRLEGRWSGEIT